MKHKLFLITIIFAGIISAAGAVFCLWGVHTQDSDISGERIVAVNEVKQLITHGEDNQAVKKAEELEAAIRRSETAQNNNIAVFVLCGVCIVFLLLVSGYFYFSIFRPFNKMKIYAEEISKGNLDIGLRFERSNYFGEFTWAFDSMRTEIVKARACEQEAIENNKTVIATLSHDIKTPIASIRAYAEAIEANLGGSIEKRRKYIEVLIRKCDEVSKLTNDLFLHSLSDMGHLQISCSQLELCDFMSRCVDEITASKEDVHLNQPKELIYVSADDNRLEQIVENLINNARKYAKTDVDVNVLCVGDEVEISFKDYGNGVADEDVPFLFEKFYRGKNKGSEAGSGLGLYIVKYLIEQMHGEVKLHNRADGFEVQICLPRLKK